MTDIDIAKALPRVFQPLAVFNVYRAEKVGERVSVIRVVDQDDKEEFLVTVRIFDSANSYVQSWSFERPWPAMDKAIAYTGWKDFVGD